MELINIREIPEYIIVNAAKDVQARKGFFSVRDIFYEILPVTRGTISMYLNHKNGHIIARIVKDAGAVAVPDRHDSKGQLCYKFEEVRE